MTVESQSIRELLSHDDIEIVSVGTGQAALKALREETFDCCVLDLRLPDMSGFDVARSDQERSGHDPRADRGVYGQGLKRNGGTGAQSGRQEYRAEGCAVARATAG